MLYFVIHFVVGLYNCEKFMCPGEAEMEWVLEFVDENTGKSMIRVNGRTMTKEQWQSGNWDQP
jgi:hypothetical protein